MSILYGRAPVVVGVDGSAASTAALARAVRAARERCVPLRVLHAAQNLFDGRWVMEAARARVGAYGAPDEVMFDLRAGTPAAALACAASGAALVVLGWGGVPEEVARAADVPVLAVHPSSDRPARRRVVAALDGSTRSVHALAFALEEADLVGARLQVVHVDESGSARTIPSQLADVIETWCAKFPEVPVEVQLRSGDVLDALVRASLEADLLVIAAHPAGHERLLGRVSREALRRAECDVAIV
jgi:nucleotide-binding universal stress UspA family protein